MTANNTTSHRGGAKHWKVEISLSQCHGSVTELPPHEYFGFLVSFSLILAKIIKVGDNVGSNVGGMWGKWGFALYS